MNIYKFLYPKYKITKPIRLTELFAGYGSQALALKYLNIPFEHNAICEWAVNSIIAYKELHFPEDNTNYSKPYTYDQLKDLLVNYGISQDYNKPMTKEQIARKNESWCRKVYNSIIATHNLVDVSKAHLEFDSTYCNILTYSFPCQDLSLAGKMEGMHVGTRSGLLWEVERILFECKNKPDILLMENVPQVHSAKNIEDFNKWQLSLEKLGYKNYFEDLNAKNYGVPQNRIYDNNISACVTTCANPYYPDNNLRIRKLTPKECFRLMGVKDEDFKKLSGSNANLYHLAGDSIVVNVLMAIFKEMI